MSAVATASQDVARVPEDNPLAVLTLPRDDPRRARRKAAYAARDTAGICGRCGRALESDEPVWREQCAQDGGLFGGTTSILAPVCKGCHSRYGRFWRAPCRHCKRPVHNAIGFQGRDVFCSERCHGELHKARLRQRRTETRGTKTCPTCGDDFAPSRSDQVMCGSVCRQKAYRQRCVTGNRHDTACAPEPVTDNRPRPASASAASAASESVTAYRKAKAGAPNNCNAGLDIPPFLDRRTVTDDVAVARRREGRGE